MCNETPIIVAEEVAERRTGKGRRINAEIGWSHLFPNANKRTSLGDRRQMSKQELADLIAEAGHPMTMNAAHLFRRNRIIRQAVEQMLEAK